MWPNLESEMDAFKVSCYDDWYRQFRSKLSDTTEAERRTKRDFLEIENSFLYLISFVLSRYEDGGWGKDTVYPQLLTSHVLRLLADMKVSLKDRWTPFRDGTPPARGNLYRASEMLINRFRAPAVESDDNFSMWGTDFWDDCYITLSLFKVRDELREMDRGKADEFDENWQKSEGWLREQVDNGFRKVSQLASWFGPGFHAGAIELFDYLQKKQIIKDASKLISALVKNVEPIVSGTKGTKRWEKRFAWQAGQLIVAWKEKRDSYPSLKKLDPHMQRLYEELKERQCDDDGAWHYETNIPETNYNTVRGLAACYVMEKKYGIENSEHIRKAQDYLLAQAQQAQPFRGDLKACVNAMEAYQRIFGFTIPNINFHLLVSLSYRLHCLGLERTILSPPPDIGEQKLLQAVRRAAKDQLERNGQSALEPLGVNGRLYDYVTDKPQLLDEFNVADHTKTKKKLRKFLSSTMTEVRSDYARSLIEDLWTREGLLNFLPLIDHLWQLEREQAFFAFYRDHLNHEVLLFLFGAYIYYENETLRRNINNEIQKTYERVDAKAPKDLEKEFLFRWKLIATFHDVGYLFEIDPVRAEYQTKADWRDEKQWLLRESFAVLDAVRANFLPDYFKQFDRLDVANIESKLTKYKPAISDERDLIALKTTEPGVDAFAVIDAMLNTIGGQRIKPGLIKDYFNLCRTTPPSEERDKFYDHGIMSALILLKVADIHRFYLRQLSESKFSARFGRFPKFRQRLMEEAPDSETQERLRIRFSHVAGAIALHNVYPTMYTEKACAAFDAKKRRKEDRRLKAAFYPTNPRSKDRYFISPDENPMAYLTALADVLQDWDRHSFRKTPYKEGDKTPIAASEVMLKCDRNQIIVTPLSETARTRYRKNLKVLKDYLMKTNAIVNFNDTAVLDD